VADQPRGRHDGVPNGCGRTLTSRYRRVVDQFDDCPLLNSSPGRTGQPGSQTS
jgi:hypothetical protein